jgi:Ca2+:H+ antiporter
VAIILLVVYICYLVFQFISHIRLYNVPSQKASTRAAAKVRRGAASRDMAQTGATTAASGSEVVAEAPVEDTDAHPDQDETERPRLSLIGAILTLAVSTALVAVCSESMVSSIEEVTSSGNISTTFIGLVLLPIVGNAAEHATAVMVAIKDKMNLSTNIALGSSIQIALFVLPLVVIIGWILENDCMTLYFDTFQVVILFVAIVLVNYIILDGKCSKYLSETWCCTSLTLGRLA